MADRVAKYPTVKGSDFWKRKMRTSFMNFDKNKNSVLNEEDFKLIAEQMVAGHQLEGAAADALRADVKTVWNTLITGIHGNGKNTAVTKDEFIANALAHITSGKMAEELQKLADVICRTMDVDHDGIISKKEFAVFCDSFGTGHLHGDIVFDILDKDGDGKISADEYLDCLYDFFLNEDPSSPYKVFRGALVD